MTESPNAATTSAPATPTSAKSRSLLRTYVGPDSRSQMTRKAIRIDAIIPLAPQSSTPSAMSPTIGAEAPDAARVLSMLCLQIRAREHPEQPLDELLPSRGGQHGVEDREEERRERDEREEDAVGDRGRELRAGVASRT